jgi:hypothetical protein
MDTLWRLLKDALSTDDLFRRVACLLFALLLADVGALNYNVLLPYGFRTAMQRRPTHRGR